MKTTNRPNLKIVRPPSNWAMVQVRQIQFKRGRERRPCDIISARAIYDGTTQTGAGKVCPGAGRGGATGSSSRQQWRPIWLKFTLYIERNSPQNAAAMISALAARG